MPEDATIAALEEQVEWYRRLAKLAELQHEYVQQSQTEQLLEVLRRRQEILEQVGRLEGSVAGAKRRWGEYLGGLQEAGREKAERLMGESKRLLEQITLADRNDVMALQQRKLNLGREIGQTKAARQVNRTYATAAYGRATPRMDVKQ